MIALERRPEPSVFWSAAAPLLAVVLTVVFGGLVFGLIAGVDDGMTAARAAGELSGGEYAIGVLVELWRNAAETIRTIFWDPLFGPFSGFLRPQLLVKAAPLVLIAVGLAMGFRAGIWNIGAEGQYIVGAICGAAAGLALYPMEARWLIFPLMVICGGLGGFLWAMIPGLLRVRFGTNEILVSLMLVYVAEQLLASMALGLLKNPEGFGFPGSRNLSQWDSSVSWINQSAGLHWGVVAALLAVIGAYVVMSRHILGFQIKLAGQSPRAAAFSGVNPSRLVLVCFAISGALAGLAGLFEVTGPSGQITISFNVGYGFTAIIVAFLGRLHPVGILLAGLLMALTYIGGELAQSQLQLPGAAIQLFQGMLLFFLLAVDVLTHFRIRLGKGATA